MLILLFQDSYWGHQ